MKKAPYYALLGFCLLLIPFGFWLQQTLSNPVPKGPIGFLYQKAGDKPAKYADRLSLSSFSTSQYEALIKAAGEVHEFRTVDNECAWYALFYTLYTYYYDHPNSTLYADFKETLYSPNFLQYSVIVHHFLSKLPDTLMAYRSIAQLTVGNDGSRLRFVSPRFRSDVNVVLTAVQQNGFSLKYASPRLRDNEQVFKAAIHQNAKARQYGSERLKVEFGMMDNGGDVKAPPNLL